MCCAERVWRKDGRTEEKEVSKWFEFVAVKGEPATDEAKGRIGRQHDPSNTCTCAHQPKVWPHNLNLQLLQRFLSQKTEDASTVRQRDERAATTKEGSGQYPHTPRLSTRVRCLRSPSSSEREHHLMEGILKWESWRERERLQKVGGACCSGGEHGATDSSCHHVRSIH